MSYTQTDYEAVLQDYYTDEKIKQQTYNEEPFFAMVPKERAGGKRYVQVVEYGAPGGSSAAFATSILNENKTKSKYEDFLIQRTRQFQRVAVDIELMYASDSPRASFQKSMKEFDRGFRSLGEKIGRRLFRTAGGACGRLANAAVNVAVATLSDRADAFNFEIGDQIQASDTDGTGALRNAGAVVEVAAVDYELGTVTMTGNLNAGIAAIAVTDFLFQQGDYGVCLSGLEDWLPITNRATKLAAAFHGVATRAPNPVRLGGVIMDGTTMGGLDEVLIKLVGKVRKHGGQTSHIFANPETLTDLQLTSNAKVLMPQEIYTTMRASSGEVIVGFSGFKVQIGDRTVKVYGARSCPSNRIYALQLDTWKLWHAGEPVNWLGEEFTGQKLTRNQNAPEMFADLGNYSNLGCSAPGWNGAASITPSAA